MFNPLSETDLTRALGATLRGAAAHETLDEFQRSQLLSAYSISRHLAAEIEIAAGLEAEFRSELAGVLPDGAPEGDLGEALCRAMAELRTQGDEESRRRLGELRAALRRHCDREVSGLAAA